METRSLPSSVLGVDVCKAHLDACLLRPDGAREERRFENGPRGIAALVAWGRDASVVGMESTGGYERGLALAASLAGRTVRVENPRRVRDFARATGRLNKTDRADARAVAGFLAKVEGRPWAPPADQARELEGLTAHRAALLQERTRVGNRLQAPGSPPALVRRQLEARLGTLGEELEELERERRRLVQEDEGLARDRDALLGLKGVGETTALLVLSLAGNVGDYPTAQAYAAAAGLAPCRRESGSWRGKSRISRQGDAALRAGLYMAAVVASRHDPLLRDFRERLVERGKTPMQAVVACMRKLLMRCYGVLKAVRNGKEPFYGERPRPGKAGGA
ncbi:MAG: IS110 family transposase [Myxococcales bacterium]|nr:MAG: IS110 family transposase [Myxococcales bacterium]